MTCTSVFRNASSLPRNRWANLSIWVGARTPLRNASSAHKTRRADIWIPNVTLKRQDEPLDATQLLARAGYLRQAYSGIYHMLPLGVRVQDKLERLIDKHMSSIYASKVSLSSITSQSLWQRSGRLDTGSEFFRFEDRREAKWLLAPTHEEEITNLLADIIHSPNQLPVRLYQITRKYRDEKRPRGGLLRGREFVMKDLYTFDANQSQAHTTYDQVRQAYRNFLSELKVTFVEARADSGNMGGDLSHEYHFLSSAGEDDVIHCSSCDFARNEEWVPDCPHSTKLVRHSREYDAEDSRSDLSSVLILDKTRTKLVKAFAAKSDGQGKQVGFNTYAIKAAFRGVLELDTGVEQAMEAFTSSMHKPNASSHAIYYLFDSSVSSDQALAQIDRDSAWASDHDLSQWIVRPETETSVNVPLLKQTSGDECPQCGNNTLMVSKAIEVGHTFHLGTRYSSKLGLSLNSGIKSTEPIPVEMGCHGIGVSRLIAAVAASMSDPAGLNWPAAIAPFHVILIADGNDAQKLQVAEDLYETTASQIRGVDLLLDDRTNVSNGYKLKDADLIGYPIIIVVGKVWQLTQRVEVQCRRLGFKEEVRVEDVPSQVAALLGQL